MDIHQQECGRPPVNSYIIGCEETGRAVVIDPGDGPLLKDLLNQLQLVPDYVVNTHIHPDHIMGNRFLKQAFGARIVRHPADEALWQDAETVAIFGRMAPIDFLPADLLVEQGQELIFGNSSLFVLHTPGHSPGSICLYGPGHLFTGDSLFVGAAGRVDLPGGDFNTLYQSLADRVAVLPEETVVWPGHDYGDTPTSTIGREKRENPFLGGEWE